MMDCHLRLSRNSGKDSFNGSRTKMHFSCQRSDTRPLHNLLSRGGICVMLSGWMLVVLVLVIATLTAPSGSAQGLAQIDNLSSPQVFPAFRYPWRAQEQVRWTGPRFRQR